MSEEPYGYLVGCITLFGLACAAAVIVGLLSACFHIGAICWAERNIRHEVRKASLEHSIRKYEGRCVKEASK